MTGQPMTLISKCLLSLVGFNCFWHFVKAAAQAEKILLNHAETCNPTYYFLLTLLFLYCLLAVATTFFQVKIIRGCFTRARLVILSTLYMVSVECGTLAMTINHTTLKTCLNLMPLIPLNYLSITHSLLTLGIMLLLLRKETLRKDHLKYIELQEAKENRSNVLMKTFRRVLARHHLKESTRPSESTKEHESTDYEDSKKKV